MTHMYNRYYRYLLHRKTYIISTVLARSIITNHIIFMMRILKYIGISTINSLRVSDLSRRVYTDS